MGEVGRTGPEDRLSRCKAVLRNLNARGRSRHHDRLADARPQEASTSSRLCESLGHAKALSRRGLADYRYAEGEKGMKRSTKFGAAFDEALFRLDVEELENATGISFPKQTLENIVSITRQFIEDLREPTVTIDELKRDLPKVQRGVEQLVTAVRAMAELMNLPAFGYAIREATIRKPYRKYALGEFFDIEDMRAIERLDHGHLEVFASYCDEVRESFGKGKPGAPALRAEDTFIRRIFEIYQRAGGTKRYSTNRETEQIEGPFPRMMTEIVRQMREQGYSAGGLFETNTARRVKEALKT